MRQKNRLYTVNKYNRQMFMPKENLFDDGGTTWDAKKYGDPNSKGGWFGLKKSANPFSKGNLAGAGKAGMTAALNAGAGLIGGLANKAISGGLESDAGSAISNIGGTIGGIAGMVNPALGMGISVGSQVLGGVANRLLGSSINQANVNKIKENAANLRTAGNAMASAATTEDLLSSAGNMGSAVNFSNSFVGSDGVFSNKAEKKAEELRRQQASALAFQNHGLATGAQNVDNIQDDTVLSNFAAYGGPLSFGGGALGLMQQNRYFDTIDKRSDAIAGKGQSMQAGFTGGAKTFDNGGLMYDFMQNFGDDPIGAVVRYNQGLEDRAAREELLRRSEEQAMQNDALQQQMEDLRLTSPNFNINITQDYGLNGVPQPKIDVAPVLPETITKTNGETPIPLSPSKAASKDIIYETLPKMLKDAGLNVRVTSGYRKAGAVGTAGNKSWHPRHGAVDIVPQGNTTFEDIENVVLTNPEIRNYMMTNGYGFLDETDRTPEGKALMKKTGATGNHFHFGRDTSARNNYHRRMNLHAFGGELGTNGTDFTNGLLHIDEGGSHESNPLDGVPMGLDPEGIPNLVEEGETVYNDYVFSDRMNVPDFMLKDLGLPKSKKGISFADASKKLAQESEQRPNDPISKDGLQASLSRLAEIQETERMRKQAEEYMGLEGYACGGKMGRKYSGTGNSSQKLESSDNKWGPKVDKPLEGMTEEEFRKEYPLIARPIDEKPKSIGWTDGSIWQGLSNMAPGKKDTDEHIEEEYNTYPTWMRYAPVLGSGIMSLTDMLGLTNKPDYTYADKIEAAANRAGYTPNVSYKPNGTYLRFNPMDIWQAQNRMSANARATDRAIINSAAPIGTKMAGLIASGYNNQVADAPLYRNALEYNDAMRERVADFNRKTDMFNSQMGLEAAMANARYTQMARQMGLSGLAQAAALRDSIDERIGAARSANLTNFLTSLGNIGRENFALNQINTDRSRNYTTTAGGKQGYKRKNR